MSEKFIINGGGPLEGEIEVRGAKNAVFPILAATVLTEEECEVSNLPLIEDVFRMIEILKSLGAQVSWTGERSIKIKTKNIDLEKIKEKELRLLRGSVLFFGPFLARFRKIRVPMPGGCLIGARPIDTHLDAFSQMGVRVTQEGDHFLLELNEDFRARTVILNEFSVTGTENVLLLASLIPAKTVIKTADSDYQVQELAKFLKKMGVKIQGVGTHTITVVGQKKLKKAEQRIIHDPIEAGTFILMAAATKGNVLIKNIELQFLELTLKKLKGFGLNYEILDKQTLKVLSWKNLKIDKIQSLPYPGIPTDLLSAFGVLATQTAGTTLLHDPLYEGRLKYLEELNRMGADIIFCDPHRAIVNGPVQLYGQEIKSPDLRGGAALIIAGLIAQGETVLDNIYQLDRGYEKIEVRLQKLGADIERINV